MGMAVILRIIQAEAIIRARTVTCSGYLDLHSVAVFTDIHVDDIYRWVELGCVYPLPIYCSCRSVLASVETCPCVLYGLP